MHIQVLNQMLLDSCRQGENLAFAVLVQGRPQIMFVRTSGHSGAGIIDTMTKYASYHPDWRSVLGAAQNQTRSVMLLQFMNIIQRGHLSLYRSALENYMRHKCRQFYGYTDATPKERLATLNDRSLQVQLVFDFDSRELVSARASSQLEAFEGDTAGLRLDLLRVSTVNDIPNARRVIISER